MKLRLLFIAALILLVSSAGAQYERQQALDTDLFLAIEQKHTDTAKELISYGADLNAKDELGYTPLMYAVAVDDADMARFLLRYGAKSDLKSQFGKTALQYAKQLKRTNIVELFTRRTRVQKKLMDLTDSLDELNKQMNNSLNRHIQMDIQGAWQKTRKKKLEQLKQAVAQLQKLQSELKDLEQEQLLNPRLDSRKKQRIVRLRKITGSLEQKIQDWLKKDKRLEQQRLLARMKQLQLMKKRLEDAKRRRELLKKNRLQQLKQAQQNLSKDLRKAGASFQSGRLKQVLSGLRTSYDRQRFVNFYNKGAERPLYTGNTTVEQIIRRAKLYLGQKYVFGGLDCSGLWYRIFRHYGINYPRTAEPQARYGLIIGNINQLKRGDMIFFTRTYKTYWFVTHIGMYLGGNRMLHAGGTKVQIIQFPKREYWWVKHYAFATRIW